jgi:signal transduction histidine kinase
MRHKNDTYRWCEGTITDMLQDPDVQAIVSNFRDITERKNAEREKEKITADVIRQNKDLEQFAYIVSHNLRSPVANIKGLAYSMDYAKNEDEKKFILNGISTAVGKLDEIIVDLNQILNNTRSNSEKREMVNFEDLVNDIRTSINDLIEKADATIETDFSEVSGMLTQKSYLHSIFYNLISNAIKYRNEEEDSLIAIKSFKNDDHIILTFRDNGIGMDLEKYEGQVFGLYKRFHYHIEGKGMGLFMVKAQVETLGGRIGVQSQVGKGSTFTIEFEN